MGAQNRFCALDSNCSPQPVASANKRPSQSATRARSGAYEGAYLIWRAGARKGTGLLVTHTKKKKPGCPAGRHLCTRAASELSSSHPTEHTSAYETDAVTQEPASPVSVQQQCAGGLNMPRWRLPEGGCPRCCDESSTRSGSLALALVLVLVLEVLLERGDPADRGLTFEVVRASRVSYSMIPASDMGKRPSMAISSSSSSSSSPSAVCFATMSFAILKTALASSPHRLLSSLPALVKGGGEARSLVVREVLVPPYPVLSAKACRCFMTRVSAPRAFFTSFLLDLRSLRISFMSSFWLCCS